jgi:iron complex outermembrane receptor protein
LETTSAIQNSKDDSHLASLFLHDEIELIPEHLALILGSKFEYNVFTGLEIQPSVRAAWNPHPNHTIWASFSRAVRLPTVSDENVTANRVLFPFAGGGECTPPPPSPPALPGTPGAPCPLLIQQVPNTGTKPEELLAYELGYRIKANDKVNFDVTAYYFNYDNLIETNGGAFIPPSVPPFVFTQQVFNDNALEGEVYGVELSGQWQVLRNWRLSGSYTFSETQLHAFPGAPVDSSQGFEPEKEPNHIFTIRSYLNLPHIPEYGRLDVRLGWQPMKNVDLSFAAQNLLDDSHPELNELLEVTSETQRSFYFKATLKF